jgi:hypothetical protein
MTKIEHEEYAMTLLSIEALAHEIEDTPDPDAEAVAVWVASVRALAQREREAVKDLREAVGLLSNARSDFGDPVLKRRWAARRKALRVKWGE